MSHSNDFLNIQPINPVQLNKEFWQAFQEQFVTEEDAITFLTQAKWPNGFHCPQCSHRHAYIINSRRLPLFECQSCHHQTSLTVGTIMENSRTPLLKWLTAFFLVAHTGIHAVQLKSLIQVTYKTSWSMLHAIRRAINLSDDEHPLTGVILGGLGICSKDPYSSTATLLPQEKPVLIGATLDELEQPTALKMKLVHERSKHLNKTSINQFKDLHVKSGANQVELYQRMRFNKLSSIKELSDLVMTRLKQTYKGLTSRHLQLYLDEACFRINMSLTNKPIFNYLSQLCMTTSRSGFGVLESQT